MYHIALCVTVVGYMQRLVLGKFLIRRVHNPSVEAILEVGEDANGGEYHTHRLWHYVGRADCGDGSGEHAEASDTLAKGLHDGKKRS